MKTTNDESNLEQFPKLNWLGIFVGNALVNIWVIGSISSKKNEVSQLARTWKNPYA